MVIIVGITIIPYINIINKLNLPVSEFYKVTEQLQVESHTVTITN